MAQSLILPYHFWQVETPTVKKVMKGLLILPCYFWQVENGQIKKGENTNLYYPAISGRLKPGWDDGMDHYLLILPCYFWQVETSNPSIIE